METHCSYIYKQGKSEGLRCPTAKLYEGSKYCKQHYNRIYSSNSKAPKIQEINSEGEPILNETASSSSSSSSSKKRSRSSVDIDGNGTHNVKIKSKREVMLDLDHLLNVYTKQPKQLVTKSKSKSRSKPKPKIEDDTSSEDVNNAHLYITPFREKTLYTQVLQSTANTCVFPMIEMGAAAYTPLKLKGFSDEVTKSPEVQDALAELIEEMVPEAVEECSPLTKLIIAIGAIGLKVHTTNALEQVIDQKQNQSNLITEEIAEKYKSL